ncbi:MAG TPA: hydrogenase formation protein HypD [Phycisphaerae bacterium]|nr:hydrogenase formation protein HypD [Phycisphaerae bacterium]
MNEQIEQLRQRLRSAGQAVNGTVRIMEVCGTHTVEIFRQGIRSLLPANVKLISGPGCPVCVTSQRFIEMAVRLARQHGVLAATYGDMIRVPAAAGSLEQVRAEGARVQVVFSARDALVLAKENPKLEVVFVAVGFETTAPATADALLLAEREKIRNFSVLAEHKLVVPAMLALLEGGRARIDGFMCPGHVSVIIGSEAYRPVVQQAGRACVVAGFEPLPIVKALTRLVEMAAEGVANLENVYTVAVSAEGNRRAQQLIDQVFERGPATWRGLGQIEGSGLRLRQAYRQFDAFERFGLTPGPDQEPPGCRCGEVITGSIEPPQCPLFDGVCRPTQPVGPCMVSSEGTCQAWWKYHRVRV